MIVVTGASGFLGGGLASALAMRGDKVRAVQRSDVPRLRELGVEVVRADLTDAAATRAALRGAAVVCHVAALASPWGKLEDFQAANVKATENVIAACRAEGIKALVFTSSPSVVQSDYDMDGVDESVPIPQEHASFYSATKAAAEALVLAANGHDLATVALRPHAIWGPGDTNLLPRILHRAKHNQLRMINGGTKLMDAVYIDNAVYAHILAVDQLRAQGAAAPCAGKVYFIANGEPKPIRDLINALLAAAGLPPCKKTVPRFVALGAAAACEQAWLTLQLDGEPWLTRFLVDMMSTAHWYKLGAAQKDLGYTAKVSTEQGLQRLQAALRSEQCC
jgi:nucleoside-diphosphate-sugar epimerase